MKALLLLIALSSVPIFLPAQARTGIGLSVGSLKPFADQWKGGMLISLDGDFRVSNKVSIGLGVGINHVQEGILIASSNTYYHTGGMAFLMLSGKYYIDKNWFAGAGSMFYLGGEDGYWGGHGATLSFGYRANLDKHFSLELSPLLYLLKPSHVAKIVPVAGFSLSFYYSRKLKN